MTPPDDNKTERYFSHIVSALENIVEKLEEILKAFLQKLPSDQDVLNRLDKLSKLIEKQGALLMSAISEFAAKQTAFNDRQDAAVSGLTQDVTELKDEILKLQNTPGNVTPEDQALLDSIQARAEAITTKLEALDALTPPTPPTA